MAAPQDVIDEVSAEMATADPATAACRVCGCTQLDACPDGCAWVVGLGNLCSVCAEAVRDVALTVLMWAPSTHQPPQYEAFFGEVAAFVNDAIRAGGGGEPPPLLFGPDGEALAASR